MPKLLHSCIYAEGNEGKNAYHCKLSGANCTSQFYCHNEKYWKPLYNIKCPNYYIEEKVDQDSKSEEVIASEAIQENTSK